jgi:ectoine hydroxylase-related dioxygenase (phytanoyl-CoA dioxygenase family)
MSRDAELIASHSTEDAQLLRDRFQEWGYLYFRAAVDALACDNLLEAILEELKPHLARDASSGLPKLCGQPFFETDPVWDAVYPRIQSLECFHRFFHQPAITGLMETLVGTKPFVYPMKMARIATPRKIGYETPPHQDAHSHQAGPTMAGIWVALHDVSTAMGRLKLLPGSHRYGVRQVFQARGVGGVQCEIFPGETSWHVSDVSRGDVVIFHSRTVHKAEPNTAGSDARISVDTRFCDYGAPVFPTNLEPHHGWRIAGLNWDSIYSRWQSSEQQYYWRDYPA